MSPSVIAAEMGRLGTELLENITDQGIGQETMALMHITVDCVNATNYGE